MRYFLFFVGILLSTIGLSYIIIYLNIMLMGFSFFDYIKYIFTRIECLSFFLGYILLLILFKKGKNK